MQINYACHPFFGVGLSERHWIWAEQNPAYHLTERQTGASAPVFTSPPPLSDKTLTESFSIYHTHPAAACVMAGTR